MFWECPFPPLVEIRENPEFHDLMREWIRVIGPGVYFGMVGFLCCLVPLVPPLGQLVLMRVLATLLNLLLVGTLLVWLLNGAPLVSMIVFKPPLWFRITPMSGLMVVLSLIRSLVFLLLELGSLLTNLISAGAVVGGYSC